MIFIIKHISLLTLAFLLFQCGNPAHEHHEEHDHHEEQGHHDEKEANNEKLELSTLQVSSAGLKYGTYDTLNISAFVKANGHLDLPPQNITAVSAPGPGFVKKVNFLIGDYVKKGQVLAILENPDYINQQEDYMKLLSELDYLEAERERQRILDSAQISAKKTYQKSEASYRAAIAKKNSLEKQLVYMGLSPKSIAGGNITNAVAIRAPFSGYITKLNVHNGEFVKSEQELYELVDNDHMHLELSVFEQDFHKVKNGQKIAYSVPSIGKDSYRGEVFLVGKSFDPHNKTVKVHGHLTGEHPDFIKGLYVDAKIYTGDQTVIALPEAAVVKEKDKSYIFILDESGHENHKEKKAVLRSGEHEKVKEHNHEHKSEDHNSGEDLNSHPEKDQHEHKQKSFFRKVEVVTGLTDQGFIEIKNGEKIPAASKIVVDGAYYLYSEMKKGEGGHHHH